MAKDKVKARVELSAPASEVMRLFTNSTAVREWLADRALINPREGGRIYLGWHDGYQTAGTLTRVVPEEGRLRFTWQGPGEDPTKVSVAWKEEGPTTTVEVRHTGFGTGKKAQRQRDEMGRAWQVSLENLKSVIETGEDLRFTRRPMLGIYLEQEARGPGGEELGVQISGVVEGMGAMAAGLQNGDIITSMAGRPVRQFADLGAALSAHRAGDEVEVLFIREGSQQSATMRLSGRRIGDVKSTPAELADQIEDINRRFLEQLTAVLDGVTEAEAGHRPGEGQWSVKEVIAHLLDGEGDQHSTLVESFEGVERYYDGGFGNSHWRTRVTADAYPDVWAMIDSYRRLIAQTVQLIRSMPEHLQRRRGTFWRYAFGFADGEDHLHEHLEQVKSALEAARAGSQESNSDGQT